MVRGTRRLLKCGVLVVCCLGLGCLTGSKQDPETDKRGSSTPKQAEAAVLRAMDLGRMDASSLAAVSRAEPALQARALLVLGLTGSKDNVPLIEPALSAEDAGVRAAAIVALSRLAPADPFDAVSTLATDSDATVRRALATTLARWDEPPIEIWTALLDDQDSGVIEAACFAVADLRDASPLVDPLIRVSQHETAQAIHAGLHTLARLSSRVGSVDATSKQRIRKRLLELSKAKSPQMRALVARGLRVPDGTDQIETVGMMVEKDPHPLVRINAIYAVSFPGAPVHPFLFMGLSDEDDRVVLAAVEGLERMRGADVVEALARVIVFEKRPFVRRRAVRALRYVDPERGAEMANGISKDEDPKLRAGAATMVEGRADETALEIGKRLVGDQALSVRLAAIPVLSGDQALLSELLADPLTLDDPRVNEAIARAAGLRLADESRNAADHEDAISVLETVWERERTGAGFSGPVARRILEAAAHSTHPRARALLEEGFAAGDRHLESVAAAQLSVPIPRDSDEASLRSYFEIPRWAAKPRAARVTIQRPGFRPGRFTVRLDTERAPLTTYRFAQEALKGAYDGQEIVDIVPGVMTRIPVYPDVSSWFPLERQNTPFHTGTLAMQASSPEERGGEWSITLSAQPGLARTHTPFGRVVQNLPGVVALLLPGDQIVSVEIYEGDGTEPLPQLQP